MKTAIIGFGDIAPKHLEVLKNLNCQVTGILTKNYETGVIKAKKYGITKAYKSFKDLASDEFDFFLILVNPDNKVEILKKALPYGKPILIEKPVSFSSTEIDSIIESNKKFNSPIMTGMNRRFYSIFSKGISYLEKKDKKIDSIVVEAPERFRDINLPKFSDNIRQNWQFCNPIHCIDLIRFFGGDIKKIEINSIPKKYVFSAIGNTEKDVEFTYISNWKSPGNWSVKLYADNIKIIFEPLEKGLIIENNDKQEIIPSKEDITFKPGFYNQLKHFLSCINNNGGKFSLPASDLSDHKKTISLIEKIFC